jgi:hypothetical protein
VGRVLPRHGHRGRPLNWVVRRQKGRASARLLPCGVSPRCAIGASSPSPVYEALFNGFAEANRVFVIREGVVAPRPDSRLDGFEFPTTVPAHEPRNFGNVRVRLISASEMTTLFASDCRDGWKTFHARYPQAQALIAISGVAYHGDEAAVYIESTSGCLAGSGRVLIFERSSGRWSFKREIPLWSA